jgi:light-regulated signal transduction histidine kinase (bacteriophytochrome)
MYYCDSSTRNREKKYIIDIFLEFFIKKTISDMHNADISVKSDKGEETTFHIRIRK